MFSLYTVLFVMSFEWTGREVSRTDAPPRSYLLSLSAEIAVEGSRWEDSMQYHRQRRRNAWKEPWYGGSGSHDARGADDPVLDLRAQLWRVHEP